jgi:hypothetical protein
MTYCYEKTITSIGIDDYVREIIYKEMRKANNNINSKVLIN